MGHQLCKVQKALGGLLLFQARQWYYHVMDSKKAPSAQSAWTPVVGREKDKCINNNTKCNNNNNAKCINNNTKWINNNTK